MFAKNIYLIYALDFHIKYIFLYIKNIYFIYIKYIWQFFLCMRPVGLTGTTATRENSETKNSCLRWGSNSQPPDLKSDALTTEPLGIDMSNNFELILILNMKIEIFESFGIFSCCGRSCQPDRSHTNEIKHDNGAGVYGVSALRWDFNHLSKFIKIGKGLSKCSIALKFLSSSTSILFLGQMRPEMNPVRDKSRSPRGPAGPPLTNFFFRQDAFSDKLNA